MKHRVCPWWLGYLLLNPLRKRGQNPGKILAPYVREGMTVLEPGPGMGFFTAELACLVGQSGRVVAVEVQPKMIDRLNRRLARGVTVAGRAQRPRQKSDVRCRIGSGGKGGIRFRGMPDHKEKSHGTPEEILIHRARRRFNRLRLVGAT